MAAFCIWCKRTLDENTKGQSTSFTKDHLVPASMGGQRWFPCCHACNQLKGDMPPHLWDDFKARQPEWWRMWPSERLRGRRLYAAWVLTKGDAA